LVLLLTGCDQSFPKEVGHDTVLYTQVETIFEHSELEKAQEEKLQLEEFCNRFQIKKYKTFLDSETQEKWPYTVCKTTEGLYLCLFEPDFSYQGFIKIKFSSSNNYEAITEIQIGMTSFDVYKLDPDGYYPYKMMSEYYSDQYSMHWFENGKCLMMVYKDDVITEIHYLTI
jgi:hypothetical protein